ncbi:MAG: DUF2306 domain-containing protein [Niveispirillum sp.]|nr:DUF2306 domain-containing protein [Niveispirillum sp.]
MSLAATIPETARPDPTTAKRWLGRAGMAWLLVALAGQMIFALYVAVIYGGVLTGGGYESWNRSPAQAYRPGDGFGNLIFGLHAIFSIVIIAGGVAQLIPTLRQRMPAFHRWTGRTYMVSAAILSLGGIALIAWRGTVGNGIMHAGTISNGIAILICAGMAWMLARRRQFDAHRRWALRLFLCVSGVWFFRVGLMAWLLTFRAPVGFDPKSFTGPFLEFLSFAQYLLPLAVLQLYLHAMDRGGAVLRWGMAGLLTVLALITAFGIFGATMGMWLPRL